MKPIVIALAAITAALSACSYHETRTIQPAPATATVVTPAAPTYTATTYTTPETTTTVYSR
ncbi:MAG: hypothetical protein U1E60_13145 [Reyranellaceae bacterium]